MKLKEIKKWPDNAVAHANDDTGLGFFYTHLPKQGRGQWLHGDSQSCAWLSGINYQNPFDGWRDSLILKQDTSTTEEQVKHESAMLGVEAGDGETYYLWDHFMAEARRDRMFKDIKLAVERFDPAVADSITRTARAVMEETIDRLYPLYVDNRGKAYNMLGEEVPNRLTAEQARDIDEGFRAAAILARVRSGQENTHTAEQVERQLRDAGAAETPTNEFTPITSTQDFLRVAGDTIGQRGTDYDKPEGERSAGAVATAFNAITKREITESEVWLILQLVKDVRQWQNPYRFHQDSAVDCVAYAALKAESLASDGTGK